MPVHERWIVADPRLEHALELAVAVGRRQEHVVLVAAWNIDLNESKQMSLQYRLEGSRGLCNGNTASKEHRRQKGLSTEDAAGAIMEHKGQVTYKAEHTGYSRHMTEHKGQVTLITERMRWKHRDDSILLFKLIEMTTTGAGREGRRNFKPKPTVGERCMLAELVCVGE